MGKLIGLTGKKGHGKDTVAKIIQKWGPWQNLAFAEPLKVASSHLLYVDLNWFNDTSLKETIIPEWGFTPRHFLQRLGTDFLRNEIDNEIFTKSMSRRLKDVPFAIVTDCRFDNEIMLVKENGGTIIRVDATERLGEGTDGHETENSVSNELIDITIYNNLGQNELESTILKEFKNLLE